MTDEADDLPEIDPDNDPFEKPKPGAGKRRKAERDKALRGKTEITPFEARRLWEDMEKRGLRVSARRVAAVFKKAGKNANWATIQKWKNANWIVKGENYASPVSDALIAAENAARAAAPDGNKVRVDDIIEGTEELIEAILGSAAYQQRELEKIAEAEEKFGKEEPNQTDPKIKRAIRAELECKSSEALLENVFREMSIAASMVLFEVTRRREYLVVAAPEPASVLFKELGAFSEKIVEGYLTLGRVREAGSTMKTVDGHEVIPPNRKNGVALPTVDESHPLHAAMKAFERGLGKKANGS